MFRWIVEFVLIVLITIVWFVIVGTFAVLFALAFIPFYLFALFFNRTSRPRRSSA